MTAQLLEYTSPSDALVRRVRAARAATVTVAPHREGNVIHAPWGATQARACEIDRQVVLAEVVPLVVQPAATRLELTPRGIAVLVSLVAIVTGVMLSTVVGAFLAVSDAPVTALIGG